MFFFRLILVYDVVAEFVTTERGSVQLVQGEYRFGRNRKEADCQRWICSVHGNSGDCFISAFTKEINGIQMACFPQEHNLAAHREYLLKKQKQ